MLWLPDVNMDGVMAYRMLSNMGDIMARMLPLSVALRQRPYSGLGMDALAIVIGCARTWTGLWLGHGCSAHQILSKRQ